MASKSQRDALIAQFQEFTTAIPADAQRLLKATKWQMNLALEAYYNDPIAQRNAERAASNSNTSLIPKLDALFSSYHASSSQNPDKDTWSIDATISYCDALSLSPEDPVMLAIAEQCGAKEMGSFERKPWIEGWKRARVDSIDGMKTYIQSTLRKNLEGNVQYFRKVYNFTFDYARDQSQRSLPLETAVPLWGLLIPLAPKDMFEENSAWCARRDEAKAQKWLERWQEFLANPKGGKGRPISKDVWLQFLDFACQMDDDLAAHDPENDAWPSTLDAFAESVKEGRSSGQPMEE